MEVIEPERAAAAAMRFAVAWLRHCAGALEAETDRGVSAPQKGSRSETRLLTERPSSSRLAGSLVARCSLRRLPATGWVGFDRACSSAIQRSKKAMVWAPWPRPRGGVFLWRKVKAANRGSRAGQLLGPGRSALINSLLDQGSRAPSPIGAPTRSHPDPDPRRAL